MFASLKDFTGFRPKCQFRILAFGFELMPRESTNFYFGASESTISFEGAYLVGKAEEILTCLITSSFRESLY